MRKPEVSNLGIIFCSVTCIILSVNVFALHQAIRTTEKKLLDKWNTGICYDGIYSYSCDFGSASADELNNHERDDYEALKNKINLLSKATGYKYVESDTVNCPAGYFKDGKRPKDDPCFNKSKDTFFIY